MNSVTSNYLSLKYQKPKTSGSIDIGIRTFEFVARTQFLYEIFPSENWIISIKVFSLSDFYCSLMHWNEGYREKFYIFKTKSNYIYISLLTRRRAKWCCCESDLSLFKWKITWKFDFSIKLRFFLNWKGNKHLHCLLVNWLRRKVCINIFYSENPWWMLE